MDVSAKLVVCAVDLFAPMVAGYCCRSYKLLPESFVNKLILNNILVIYPALSFLSFWVLPLHIDLIWLPVMGLVMGLVPGVAAYFVAERKYASYLDRGSYVMSAILSNLGTIGGLCVFFIYGETGYAYQQLVVLFQYVLMFMFCYPLAQYYYQRSANIRAENKISAKAILFNRNQLAVIGILVGGVLNIAGIPRPPVLGYLSEPLIHIGAWTALIPVGYSIDFVQLKKYYKDIIDISLIKFIFTPAITYGVAWLLISDIKMINTLLILSFTPTAINAVITSRIYNLNVHIAVAAFVLTTLIFLLAVYPVLFFWLTR